MSPSPRELAQSYESHLESNAVSPDEVLEKHLVNSAESFVKEYVENLGIVARNFKDSLLSYIEPEASNENFKISDIKAKRIRYGSVVTAMVDMPLQETYEIDGSEVSFSEEALSIFEGRRKMPFGLGYSCPSISTCYEDEKYVVDRDGKSDLVLIPKGSFGEEEGTATLRTKVAFFVGGIKFDVKDNSKKSENQRWGVNKLLKLQDIHKRRKRK